jgi:DNA polymerase elongation subunit (family B)
MHHGKVLQYSCTGSKIDKVKTIASLPKRKDFLNAGLSQYVEKAIAKRSNIYFMPNDLVEQHYKTNGSLKYKLVIFGVLFNGAKAAIVVENTKLFFDVKIPDGADSESFSSDIRSELRSNNLYTTMVGHEKMLPFDGYQENESKYIRLYFNTTWQRSKSIEYIRRTTYEYMKNGKKCEVRLKTAEDDKSSHYRKFSREYKILLCDWNRISDYELDNSGMYVNHNNVEYCFIVNADNIKSIDNIPEVAKKKTTTKYLRYDKSMLATWDIETYSNVFTGNAPDKDIIFDDDDKEADIMFMDCMTFGWYSDDGPFLRVCLTDMPTPPRDDCLIVQCDNQMSISEIKGHLLGRMAPEWVSGFNDGQYDWPFLINRMKEYDKRGKKMGIAMDCMETFKRNASCLAYSDENARYAIKGEVNESKIKIDAETYVDATFFRVPGYIPIDVRIVFRRLMPNAEKSSLNFFLSVCKLGSKEDMPYQTMFKIYRLMRDLSRDAGTKDYAKIMEYVANMRVKYGDSYMYYDPKNVKERGSSGISPNKFTAIDNSTYGAEKLNMEDICILLGEATDVVKYCNVDAQRCHELLKIRNVIPDHRETANLSFTSMDDSIYKADGMRVRNLVISKGIEKKWNIAFSNISNGIKDERKYPGAYVVPPKKGLYRDHAAIKFARTSFDNTELEEPEEPDRKRMRSIDGKAIRRIPYEYTDTQNEKFKPIYEKWRKIGVSVTVTEMQEASRVSVDENNETDRPCVGLDFSSLYPSEIMTWNLSPEKLIRDEAFANLLMAKGVRLKKVNVPYFKDGEPPESRQIHVGWIVQHTPRKDSETGNIVYDGMALYPDILKWLYDRRNSIKKSMEYFAEPKEFLEKVFESKSMDEIAQMSLKEQQDYILDLSKAFIETQEKAFESADTAVKKKFYGWKVHGAKSILEFFQKEWFADGVLQGKDIRAAYEEIAFQWSYFNMKQLALKRFMNTFYGETGNSLSPFFAVEIAGGVTTNGQESIRLVKKYVEERGYRVLYGDTDSLYICSPESIFKELDEAYLNGSISKTDYWKGMIELTMEDLDKFKDEVNNMLYLDNGTRFLKMAYEEVLWPFAMVGKKKYIGVQHQGIVNLAICMPECTLQEFMKSKSLFIRGLEIKKRGGSDFMRINCYKVWKDAFCITETRTLREIVESNLQEIMNHKWESQMFARSKKYKLPAKGKPGNVSVLRLVNRMKHIEKNQPQLGIQCPEIGERFPVVYTKKYPWKYGITGTKVEKSKGEKMEFFESLNNKPYKEFLENEEGISLEIDMDYYMTGEICGQFARFLLYHPNYDHHFEDWMYEDDEAYKKADKKAHTEVKRVLVNYYNSHYGNVYPEFGGLQKNIYNKVRARARDDRNTVYTDIYGKKDGLDTTDILHVIDKLEYVAYHNTNIEDDVDGYFTYKDSRKDISEKFASNLMSEAKKMGEACAETLAPYIASDMGMSLTSYYGAFFVAKLRKSPITGKIIRITSKEENMSRLQNSLRMKERELKILTKKYRRVSEDTMNEMGKVMTRILKDNNIVREFSKPLEDGGSAQVMQDEVMKRIDMHALDDEVFMDDDDRVQLFAEITQTYRDIAAVHKKIKEWSLDEAYLKDHAREDRAPTAKDRASARRKQARVARPSSITNDSESESFDQWLKSKSAVQKIGKLSYL